RASSLDGIDYFDNVAVFSRSRRFDEDGLFDAIVFFQIGAVFHTDFVGALVFAVFKRRGQFLRQRRRIVYRSERILVQLDLQILRDGDHQSQRIWFQLAQVFIRIALRRNVSFEPARLQRRDDHEDNQQHQQHVNQRSYVDVWLGRSTTSMFYLTISHRHLNISSFLNAFYVVGLAAAAPPFFLSATSPILSTPSLRTSLMTVTTSP